MIIKLVFSSHKDVKIAHSRIRLALFFIKEGFMMLFKKRRFVAQKSERKLMAVSGNVLVGPWGLDISTDKEDYTSDGGLW